MLWKCTCYPHQAFTPSAKAGRDPLPPHLISNGCVKCFLRACVCAHILGCCHGNRGPGHDQISSVVSFHHHHQLIGAGAGAPLNLCVQKPEGELCWLDHVISRGLIPVAFFAECVPESQLNPGFAWSGPNFRFASVEDFGAARLTQFPAPFLWLALAATAPRPLGVEEFVTKG